MNVHPEDVFLGNCFSSLLGIAVLLIGRNAIGSGLDNSGYKKAGLSLGGIILITWFALSPHNTNVLSLITVSSMSVGGSWIGLAVVAEIRRKQEEKRQEDVQKSNHEMEERRRRDQDEEHARQLRWQQEREAPVRRQEAEREEAENGAQAEAMRRREDARVGCELEYSLHAPDIKDRFSRADFDAYLNKYMTDKHSPDHVEERARQLKAIIDQHVQKIEPARNQKRKTLTELAQWFEETRTGIQAQAIPDNFKKAQLAQLNVRYQALVQEVLEEMQP